MTKINPPYTFSPFGLTKDEVDAYQKLVKKYKAIDVVLFAKELGIDVFLESMVDHEYGDLVYDDGVTIPYIVLDENRGHYYNRFLVANLLGEHLFYRKYGALDDNPYFDKNKTKKSFAMEFAKELLVPHKLFLKFIDQSYRYYFIKLLKFLKFIDYEEYCERKDLIIAKYFKVPTNVITIRKHELLGIV